MEEDDGGGKESWKTKLEEVGFYRWENCGKWWKIFTGCLEVKGRDNLVLRFLSRCLPAKSCSGEWKVKAVVGLTRYKYGKKWKSASI